MRSFRPMLLWKPPNVLARSDPRKFDKLSSEHVRWRRDARVAGKILGALAFARLRFQATGKSSWGIWGYNRTSLRLCCDALLSGPFADQVSGYRAPLSLPPD